MSEELRACTRCPRYSMCGGPVPGLGAVRAPLFIVGDVPGKEEDLETEPFVGRRRKLLEEILKGAGIDVQSVYLTNLIKCAGDTPTAEHIATCKSWLWQEIQAHHPKVIVTLGRIPTKVLLCGNSVFSLVQVLGKLHTVPYMDAFVAPWHPMNKLLQGGKAFHDAAIKFFSSVKEKISVRVHY